MVRISMVQWMNERRYHMQSDAYHWFCELDMEVAPEFNEALTLPRAWWAMLSCAHLAGCGVQEAAALLCKMLGTSCYCPQLRLLNLGLEDQLLRDPDAQPTKEQRERHAGISGDRLPATEKMLTELFREEGITDLPIVPSSRPT